MIGAIWLPLSPGAPSVSPITVSALASGPIFATTVRGEHPGSRLLMPAVGADGLQAPTVQDGHVVSQEMPEGNVMATVQAESPTFELKNQPPEHLGILVTVFLCLGHAFTSLLFQPSQGKMEEWWNFPLSLLPSEDGLQCYPQAFRQSTLRVACAPPPLFEVIRFHTTIIHHWCKTTTIKRRREGNQ